MFAYVFWHRPRPDVERAVYETALARFLDALGHSAPEGLLRAATCRAEPVPWLAGGGPGYEDWYVLASSAALDTLEHAAVTGRCEAPHGAVAALAANGTAGLYRHVGEGPDRVADAPGALWLEQGTTARPVLMDTLGKRCQESGASLWVRRLTLGPAPEFCLLGVGPEAGEPSGLNHSSPIWVARRAVGDT